MKKIILLFFTFLGICSCFSQGPLKAADSLNGFKEFAMSQRGKKDTLVAKEKPSLRFYPNPTKNKAEIDIKGFTPGYVKIQLINTAGKLLREEKRLVLSGNEVIIFMFSEKPGLYFLFLKQGKIMLKSKLLIH